MSDSYYFNNGYGMGSGYSNPSYNQTFTNVIRVTSLEEAVMQTTRRPSDMVYFNQDKDEFYNVKVDYDGRKTWATFTFALPNPEASAPATRADIIAISDRVAALEAKLGGTSNAEPNG